MNPIILSAKKRSLIIPRTNEKFFPVKLIFSFILLFSGLTNYAQAPGGVSAGLQAWYKADAGTTLSGSRVTGWNDQSGNGFNTTQGTYTGPTLTYSACNYNPGLTFTSSGNYLQRATPGIFASAATYNNLNYYCVYNTTNATNFKWLVYQGNGQGYARFSQSMNYSGGPNCDMDFTTTNRLSYPTSGRVNVPVIVSYLASTSAISGTSKLLLYLNGGSVISGTTYTPFVGPNNPFEIGNHVFTSGDPAAPFIGNIHEIIVYTGANSITQKRQIESYLAIKYGDTLNRVGSGGNYLNSSGTSIFSDGGASTYWNNIIGIARDDNSGLYQKQSHQLDDSARIYLSSLQTTNAANTGTFTSNNQFVMLGNNNASMANTVSTQYPSGYGISGRMDREWQITNTGFTGTYSIDIKLPASVCTIDPSKLMLIVGSNSNLTTANVYTASSGLTFSYSGGVITIGNISTSIIPLNSTRYFTLNMNVASVGGTASSAQIICPGSAPSNLTLSGNTGNVIKWQYSTDNFVSDINDIASSAVTTLTSAQMGTISVNTYYRAVVQNGVCSTANSSAVLITMKPGPTITSVTASPSNICLGSSSNLAVSATGTSNVATTIVNYDFNTGTSYATLSPILSPNITCTVGGTATFDNSGSGTKTKASAFTNNGTAGNPLFTTTNGNYWTFTLGGTSLSSSSSFEVYFQARRTNGSSSSTLTLESSTDGGTTFTNAVTITLSTKNTWYEGLFTSFPGTNFPTSGLIFRINSNSGNDVYIDNFQVQAAQPNTTYSWAGAPSGTAGLPVGAGSALTTNNNITVNPTDTTNYTVTVTNSNGCSQTGNVTVSVNPLSVGGKVDTSTTVCLGANSGKVYLTGQTGSVVKWQYSQDGGSNWTDITNDTTFQKYSNLTDTTMGRAVVQSGACPAVNSTPVTITVVTPGSWTGSQNTDWNDSRNWLCGQIPTSTIDVTISSGASHYPIINSGIDTARKVTIKSGGSLTITNGTLQIYGAISNLGTFDASLGTIEMKGTGAQTIDGSVFYNKTIKNLIVSNTGSGLSVSSAANDTLKITGTLSFGNGSATLNTGDNITLVSNSAGTANVGIVGAGNTINGKVTVERYINIGTATGQHAKSWQFLATPTVGQTVKQSWMENGNTPAGYGTQITGAGGIAAGFDDYTASPSLKYYNPASDSWVGVTGTGLPIYDSRGYMVFVRGDRSVVYPQPANNTTLRTKGTLLTGTQPSISVIPDKYASIGNPYASPVDFTLISKGAGIDAKFYVWDPYLYGSYGVGGYQTLSSASEWKPVPGGTSAYPSGIPSYIIQSGQAFFVHATSIAPFSAPDYQLTFSENNKVGNSSSQNVSRQAGLISAGSRQFFGVSLYTGSGAGSLIADGNTVAFDRSYSDNVDGNDALKLINGGENFGLKRNGKILAIEARAPIATTDTIFYNMSNLQQKTYQLRFAPVNMGSTGMQAFLIDKFLNTSTPVSLTDSSFIDISVTSNPASYAANRFEVVFRTLSAMPVTFTSITAAPKNADIKVDWNVENENGIQVYEVEESGDGSQFIKTATIAPQNNGTGNYSWLDENVNAGYHYYRVRSIGKDGQVQYTKIVKVFIGKMDASISVYPNPILNGNIHLLLSNQSAGVYGVRLLNSLGQVLVSRVINHGGGSTSEEINPDQRLPKGVYQLEVTKPDGNVEVIKLIK